MPLLWAHYYSYSCFVKPHSIPCQEGIARALYTWKVHYSYYIWYNQQFVHSCCMFVVPYNPLSSPPAMVCILHLSHQSLYWCVSTLWSHYHSYCHLKFIQCKVVVWWHKDTVFVGTHTCTQLCMSLTCGLMIENLLEWKLNTPSRIIGLTSQRLCYIL